MAKISGILTDGVGNIINNCTIELYAKKTTNKVLTQTQAFQVAENGSYTMNVLPCDYEVKLIINGFPPKKLGTIQVFSDSKDGTLNDFLLNPSESEITPAILQQVIDARNHANKAAEKAADSERNSKTAETNAKTSADNAKVSETNANNFSQSARESATTAANASAAASSSENAANSFVESARLSATASANSAEQSSNSAVLAQQSENNAKQSEQNAAKSAEDARQHASSIDISNFIKKTGEQQQSIDCSLDVKQITEQGRRVYSPNNKPTADDVGAIPAVKSVVNNSLIYESCVSIDVASLTVNGHAVITDVSNIHEQINRLNSRIYIVESYVNGNGWYNVYSNGFIEQSDAQFIDTTNINAVCSNFINLLKPMSTQTYGVSIDKISSGPWAQTEFAYADASSNGFWLTSFTPSIAGRVLVRWTVRGY